MGDKAAGLQGRENRKSICPAIHMVAVRWNEENMFVARNDLVAQDKKGTMRSARSPVLRPARMVQQRWPTRKGWLGTGVPAHTVLRFRSNFETVNMSRLLWARVELRARGHGGFAWAEALRVVYPEKDLWVLWVLKLKH